METCLCLGLHTSITIHLSANYPLKVSLNKKPDLLVHKAAKNGRLKLYEPNPTKTLNTGLCLHNIDILTLHIYFTVFFTLICDGKI